MTDPKSLSELRMNGAGIYSIWKQGGKETAAVLIKIVPREHLPYVIMTATVLAVHEQCQFRWSQFIGEITN